MGRLPRSATQLPGAWRGRSDGSSYHLISAGPPGASTIGSGQGRSLGSKEVRHDATATFRQPRGRAAIWCSACCPSFAPIGWAFSFVYVGSSAPSSASAGRAARPMVAGPDAIKHVLVDNHRNYTSPTRWRRRRRCWRGPADQRGGLLARQRRMIQPMFHRERIEGFGATMTESTEACWSAGGTMPSEAPPTTSTRR